MSKRHLLYTHKYYSKYYTFYSNVIQAHKIIDVTKKIITSFPKTY